MAITKTITPLPTPPTSADAATFRQRADAFLPAVTALGTEINELVPQINASEQAMSTSEVNAKASEDNAATSAATATAKALIATAVVIPTAATYSYTQQDWRQSIRSKATFNGAANEVKFNRAGSGFDEFGWGSSTRANINDGMYVDPSWVNYFNIGSAVQYGTSKTANPILSINGIIQRINNLNHISSGYNSILLPPAPTVLLSTATLTQQQIDSGVIKHADASNSGLIVNGKFDTDTSGWIERTGYSTTITWNATGKINVKANTSGGSGQQTYATVIGKKYILEGVCDTSGGVLRAYSPSGSTNAASNASTGTGSRLSLEFTATESTTYVWLYPPFGDITNTYTFDNIAVFPADAISRSDLVFLESWHEDVSEKDFVYPLGNVQYLGTTGDSGTPVAGAFAGAVTYSLFSDTWQADSALVGKGYVWSTLSDANKKAFVANPENNCYLDGDKVIQVRYRMRVQLGEDTWTMAKATVQGKAVAQSTTLFTAPVTTVDAGLYSNTSATYTYTGTTTSAIEVCRVGRRNQGMMHPVYNPNGTKLASDSLPWYSTTVPFTSIADCFTDSKLLTASGYIGTTTGRADGIFYDQVHEGDITDLRVNSRGMNDYQRTSDKWFTKLQDGTYRGTEGEWSVERYGQFTIDDKGFTGYSNTSVRLFGSSEYSFGTYGITYGSTSLVSTVGYMKGESKWYKVSLVDNNNGNTTVYLNPEHGNVSADFNIGTQYQIVAIKQSTRTKSNTLTHTDIIGSPTNYPTAWKQSGVNGTPLIVAEDGTSLLPTGTTGSDGLAVFKLSRKANATPLQVLKSTDSGATWTALTVTTHYIFSTTTNAITFTSGNIPLVADLVRVTYQTHTNMAVPSAGSEVLSMSDSVTALNYTGSTLGANLVSTLIGKQPTASAAVRFQVSASIKEKQVTPAGVLISSFGVPVTHEPIYTSLENSPTVKVFHYLTRSNGKARLNLVFAEMKYGSYLAPTTVTAASATYTINLTYKVSIAGCALDGKVIQWSAATTTVAIDWSLYDVSPTGVIYLLSSGAVYSNARLYDGDSWGDSGKFSIVDNVSTTTDLNGQTILIGQKSVELPFFIGASE